MNSNDLRAEIERLKRSMAGIVLTQKAQNALAEEQLEQLEYLHTLAQTCIDQGKGMSAAIARIEKALNTLEQ